MSPMESMLENESKSELCTELFRYCVPELDTIEIPSPICLTLEIHRLVRFRYTISAVGAPDYGSMRMSGGFPQSVRDLACCDLIEA